MALIRTYKNLTRAEKHLFIEAAYETLLARIVTTFCKTRQYTSWLGQSNTETAEIEPSLDEKNRILQIKTAISRCRHLVWSRKCLVEAVAAQRMLRKRHISSTLYLGVAKDNQTKLIAHAWVRSGNIWVSGGKNHQRYSVVGRFAD